MVNFKEIFKKIEGEECPQKRNYKGKTIFLVDKFPAVNKEKLIVAPFQKGDLTEFGASLKQQQSRFLLHSV
jgi:hypothetical protein